MSKYGYVLFAVTVGLADLAAAGTVTLNPAADARILSIFSSTNYASDILSTYNNSGNEQWSLVQFDFGAVPNGMTIDNATLRLYGHSYFGSTAATTISTYRVATAWDEASVTWLQASTGHPWTLTSGNLVGTNGTALTDPYGVWSGNQTDQYRWYELDVTSLVAQEYAGTYPNYGIGLTGLQGNQLVFVPSEDIGLGQQYPELVVDYLPVPEPTTLLGLAAGLLSLGSSRLRRRTSN